MAAIHQALVDELSALSGLAALLLHELVHLQPLVTDQPSQLACFSTLFFQKAPCSW